MKVICAWDGKEMGEKEPYADKSISHAICDACLAKMREEVNQYYLQHDLKKEVGK